DQRQRRLRGVSQCRPTRRNYQACLAPLPSSQLCDAPVGVRHRSTYHPDPVGPSQLENYGPLPPRISVSPAPYAQSSAYFEFNKKAFRKMIRPPLEVADIVRTYGTAFVKQRPRWLTALHLKVLRAIVACRTAALGGQLEQCDSCGQRAISYNSCFMGSFF